MKLCEVPKKLEECEGDEARCTWFVKNSRLMAEILEGELGTGIGNILKAAEIAAFSTEKKQLYEKDVMSEKDRYAYYETAKRLGREEGLEQGIQKGLEEGHAEGRQEGHAEGRAEGLHEGTISVARNLKSMGLSIEQIIQGTGLSAEQIAAL